MDLDTVYIFSPSEGQKDKGIGAKYDLLRHHNETEIRKKPKPKNPGSEGTESNAGLKSKIYFRTRKLAPDA